jgi:hypothetical protein
MWRARSLLRRCSLLLPLACLLMASQAGQLRGQIDRLEASFIANFPAYVQWPNDIMAGSTLRIGLVGPDPLGPAGRQYLKGRFWGSYRYVIEQTNNNFDSYQILVIQGLSKKETEKILKSLKRKPVLTVGQMPGFLQMGGVVNFKIHGKAVTFEVSESNGNAAGLNIDPRLATYGATM